MSYCRPLSMQQQPAVPRSLPSVRWRSTFRHPETRRGHASPASAGLRPIEFVAVPRCRPAAPVSGFACLRVAKPTARTRREYTYNGEAERLRSGEALPVSTERQRPREGLYSLAARERPPVVTCNGPGSPQQTHVAAAAHRRDTTSGPKESRSSMGKKRKPECDLEVERGLYSSFKTAANAVTQLYSHTIQAQRRSHEAGSRASLEKMMHWLIREHSNSATVSTAAIAQYLRREMEACDGRALAQAPVFPAAPPAMPAHSPVASSSPRMIAHGLQDNSFQANAPASQQWPTGCPPVQFGLSHVPFQKDGPPNNNCGFGPMNGE